MFDAFSQPKPGCGASPDFCRISGTNDGKTGWRSEYLNQPRAIVVSKEKDLRELFHDTLQDVRTPLTAIQDKW